MGSRVKALRRWFLRFPKKAERKSGNAFLLEVKPEVSKKVSEIVEKYQQKQAGGSPTPANESHTLL